MGKFKISFKRFMSFIILISMLLQSNLSYIVYAYSSQDILNVYSNGEIVTEIDLPKDGRVQLEVEKVQSKVKYQWQINAFDTWINIDGENSRDINISYAMVATLEEDGYTKIRCKAADEDTELYSEEVGIYIDDSADEFDVEEDDIYFDEDIYDVEEDDIYFDEDIYDVEEDDIYFDEDIYDVEEDDIYFDEDIYDVEEDDIYFDEEDLDFDLGEFGVASDSNATYSLFSRTRGIDEPSEMMYTIKVNYLYADDDNDDSNNVMAYDPWIAEIVHGESLSKVIRSPEIIGYISDMDQILIEIDEVTEDVEYTVYYEADDVDYTVVDHVQNVDDDKYSTYNIREMVGKTGSQVGEGLELTELINRGYYSLKYDISEIIAADGSTVIDIYYDRYYYLISFDLDGGYGVDPIYARLDSNIGNIPDPVKAGHIFKGWTLDGESATLPTKMPYISNKIITYKALWETVNSTDVQVVFWGENPDDSGFSYIKSEKITAPTGAILKYTTNGLLNCDKSHTHSSSCYIAVEGLKASLYDLVDAPGVEVKPDGTTVMNVKYTRKTFTLTFKSSNKVVKTISGKWGSNIHDLFPIIGTDNKDYKGVMWIVPRNCETFEYGNYLLSIDIMPSENITFTSYNAGDDAVLYYYTEALPGEGDHTYNGRTYNLYKSIYLPNQGRLTKSEEFHDIPGFKQGEFTPSTIFSSRIASKMYLYYTRNSYGLEFYSSNKLIKTETGILYGDNLGDADFAPSDDYIPDTCEPGSVQFGGWYLNPEGTGDQYILSEHTMPDASEDGEIALALYAKWIPVEYRINVYLTKDMEDPLGETQYILHGDTAEEPLLDSVDNGDYLFAGWFYIDENGNEKAFDFSLPIKQDLDIYAKWASDTLVSYKVRYMTQDENGNMIPIADETSGKALSATNKTFYAKSGDELYAGYQTGYYPVISSYNTNFTEDQGAVLTFTYIKRDFVDYTVKYLVDNGDGTVTELFPSETKSTPNSVVSEVYKYKEGYLPDVYIKSLTLQLEDNELIFWYTEDSRHTPVYVIHYVQNADGTGYSVHLNHKSSIGEVGTDYEEAIREIKGFEYSRVVATTNTSTGVTNTDFEIQDDVITAELPIGGLNLEIYYDRLESKYQFKFLEKGTDKVLSNTVDGVARYQSAVKLDSKNLDGYRCISDTSQTINVRLEEDRNIRTFYYEELKTEISYIAGDGGTVSQTFEDAFVMSGSLKGSRAIANPGYKFSGWYLDESYETPVDDSLVAGDSLKHLKSRTYSTIDGDVSGYEYSSDGYKYYAKFERDIMDIVIIKTFTTGLAPDEDEVFMFDIEGYTNDGEYFETTAKILGKGSIRVKDVPYGTYTVTERDDWSYRYLYECTSNTDLDSNDRIVMTVSFTNRKNPAKKKWLGADNYKFNIFN